MTLIICLAAFCALYIALSVMEVHHENHTTDDPG